MKGLDSIIRLKRWTLEEQRRKLGELHHLHQQVQDQMQALDGELAEAQAKAHTIEPAAQFVFGGYVAAAREKQAKLTQTLAEIDAAVLAETDRLAGLFQEVKRFEIVRQRAENAASAKIQKREQEELDALGLLPFTSPDPAQS